MAYSLKIWQQSRNIVAVASAGSQPALAAAARRSESWRKRQYLAALARWLCAKAESEKLAVAVMAIPKMAAKRNDNGGGIIEKLAKIWQWRRSAGESWRIRKWRCWHRREI
jgi:hypothetical protein